MLVNFQKQKVNPKKFVMGDTRNKSYIEVLAKTESHYVLDVLLYVKNKLTSDNVLQPGSLALRDGRLGVVPVILHPGQIGGVSTIQMNLPSQNLTSAESLKQVELLYQEIMKRFDKLPLLDPKDDMEIEDSQLDEYLEARAKVTRELDKLEAKWAVSEAQRTQYERK